MGFERPHTVDLKVPEVGHQERNDGENIEPPDVELRTKQVHGHVMLADLSSPPTNFLGQDSDHEVHDGA